MSSVSALCPYSRSPSGSLANSLRDEYQKFERAGQAAGGDAAKKFTRWRRLLIETTQAGYYLACGRDPVCRTYLTPFAKAAILSQLRLPPQSPSPGRQELQRLLPDDPAAMSEEQAVQVLLTWSGNIKAAHAAELAGLQRELGPPTSVRTHVTERQIANLEFAIYRLQVEQTAQPK